jgi:hypothetical protein
MSAAHTAGGYLVFVGVVIVVQALLAMGFICFGLFRVMGLERQSSSPLPLLPSWLGSTTTTINAFVTCRLPSRRHHQLACLYVFAAFDRHGGSALAWRTTVLRAFAQSLDRICGYEGS